MINIELVDLRSKYKVDFEKEHDVRLGFMSFFTKASVEALKRFPAVNASLDGNDIVIIIITIIDIAIGSQRGLVVPICATHRICQCQLLSRGLRITRRRRNP